MSNIFISYNRHSEAIARTLADDIEVLGHNVWFDQELRGGQVWWDQILATVRDCDVFVFVLDPKALNSTACKREYGYAVDLGKPILPVLVAEGMSTNLLPPALSQIQFVDYRKQDRDAVLRLARAVTTVPPPKPLPDPLPLPPEVPISYLGRLAEHIETTSTLNFEQQSALVIDLKRSLRDPETADDAGALIESLRKRRDLLATIAEEIDGLLGSIRKASSAPPRAFEPELPPQEPFSETPRIQQKPPGAQRTQRPATQPAPTNASRKTTPRERWIGAFTGAFLGTIVGVTTIWTVPYATDKELILGLLTGAGGAIAGAISGTHRQGMVGVLLGAALGWFLGAIFWGIRVEPYASAYRIFVAGLMFGAPLGAILGAILGTIKAPRSSQVGVRNEPQHVLITGDVGVPFVTPNLRSWRACSGDPCEMKTVGRRFMGSTSSVQALLDNP